MGEIRKHPQVIRDLIDIATYMAEYNLEQSDRFLYAAESTFQRLGNMPQLGKQCQFSRARLQDIRQLPVTGFRNYLVFYRTSGTDVEIIRVLHGARDIATILEGDGEDHL